MATYSDEYLEFVRENYDPVAEQKRVRLGLLNSLIDDYNITKEIRAMTMSMVRRYAAIVRESADNDEATEYIGYIRTCKELVETIDKYLPTVRRKIKEVRNGAQNSRRKQ